MIPVTSFAGKTVAVFGLGGSGLASCHALQAGGAEVIAGDDNADNVAKAAQAGFITADLRSGFLEEFRRADPHPRRAADPSGATLERAAGARGRRRGDRRHRVVLPRAPPPRAGRAVRRDHRHQRQVDHDRADRASDEGRGLRHPDGRQYRHRDPVAGAAAHGPRACRSRCRPTRSISRLRSIRPSASCINVSEDHIDRHGTLQHYAAVKERLVAGVQPRGTSIVGVDDGWCRDIADRLDQAGKRVVRISVKNPLRRRHLCRARDHRAGVRRRTQRDRADRRHRLAARPAQCAERGLRGGLHAGARRQSRPIPCRTACAASRV